MAAIPLDLLDRIRSLERQVRALMGSANTRPAMDRVKGGNVVISDGGRLAVRDSEGEKGAELLYIGKSADVFPNRPDGTAQSGFMLRRDDGSVAMAVRTDAPDIEPRQSVRIFDGRSNAIVADDTAGEGLARPYLPYPLPAPVNTARWETTTSTEWTTLHSSTGIVQHPALRCLILITEGGEARLLVNGVPVGPAGPGPLEFTAPVGLPFDTPVTFEVQARVTRPGATVGCSPRALYGVKS
ncbi:hypothetical protein ACSNOK_17895 [Streptomyces sp. URMC 126]|uniref:hypothetical protein n=1 Tax=Streptomyces sp. URMC 126 TaxID=3423401 RepID=UPI003F1B800F